MTGRGAGYCAGYETPGYANPGGFGFGFGRGRGRGFGRGFYGRGIAPHWGWNVPPAAPTAPTREQELDMLKSQADALKHSLEGIEKRMQDLESKTNE
jgi:hypothetical protein